MTRRTILILLLGCCFTTRAHADPTVLAENRRALHPIVISRGCSDATKAVAAELADYLGRITGATFKIEAGDGTTGVVLGNVTEFPDPNFGDALQIRDGYDGREAFAIRTESNRLRLIGATDLGTSHAAFRLLERLGCRWFFQAKEWDVVPPAQSVLRVSINESDRPALLSRRIAYGYGYFRDPGKPSILVSRSYLDHLAWQRHNLMASSLEVNSGHAWQSIILANKSVFEQHPEYVALVNGQRQLRAVNPAYPEVQLCISNPEVRAIVCRYAVDYFRTNPKSDMVSVETSDGLGQCECDNCRALGPTMSDRVYGMANEAAKAVAAAHPGKMVGMLAYSDHSDPPSIKLEPNVYVQLTRGFNAGRYAFDELIELWPRVCRNMGYYEYFSVWAWDWDMLPCGRAANIAYLKSQIPRYAAHNATSLHCESGDNWGPHGPGYYLAAKLMWDPKADADAILADFYEKAFGAAAAGPMRRFYELFDPGNKPWRGEALLGEGFRDVDEATRLAADRPDVMVRLTQLKQYLRYVELRWLFDFEADRAKRKDLALQILTHVFRTRYSYMNHWTAMWNSWSSNMGAQFGEPSWGVQAPDEGKPWANAQPYSAEETERVFEEGLNRFPRAPDFREEKFSSDVVPVKFPGSAPAGGQQMFISPAPYAFYSVAGEPLSFEWMFGLTAKKPPPATYRVVDSTGAAVASGDVPRDGQRHHIEISVPRAGPYRLQVNDRGTGWLINVPAEVPCSIEMPRDGGLLHAGSMQPMYFYVPKGTRQIQFYVAPGYAFAVHDPDGKLAHSVPATGGYVSVDVPAGADGRPWCLKQFVLTHLWFFNVPNYIAASPDALLVPREVAEKDGLEIRRPK